MEFRDVVRRRRMVRRYTDEGVDPAVVDRMLAHAIRAPSAGFSQGWAFLVLDEPADVGRFWSATTPPGAPASTWLVGMRTAPVVVVPLACRDTYVRRYAEPDKGRTPGAEEQIQGQCVQAQWPVPYWYVDTGMASLLMLLTAVDEGVAACFFGIPPERVDPFRTEFGVPDDHTPIGAIAVGHPASDRPSPSLRRGRRGLDEVVHRGHW